MAAKKKAAKKKAPARRGPVKGGIAVKPRKYVRKKVASRKRPLKPAPAVPSDSGMTIAISGDTDGKTISFKIRG